MTPSPVVRKPLARRALLRWALPALGVSLALDACAAATGGLGVPRSYTLSEARLGQLVGQRFPMKRSVQGLADVTLHSPQMRLLPDRNRLGTVMGMRVAEPFTGRAYEGQIELDYGLRFDAAERTIRMADVHVSRLDFPGAPAAVRSLLAGSAPRVAEHALDGMALYQVPSEQMAVVNGLGWRVGGLNVTAQGLRVDLLPP